jgi:hypothetical protein
MSPRSLVRTLTAAAARGTFDANVKLRASVIGFAPDRVSKNGSSLSNAATCEFAGTVRLDCPKSVPEASVKNNETAAIELFGFARASPVFNPPPDSA